MTEKVIVTIPKPKRHKNKEKGDISMGLVNIGPETEQIEYKKTIGEIKEAMISIAAILNKHQQGELYFGVKNDGTVVGQEINDETLRKVS